MGHASFDKNEIIESVSDKEFVSFDIFDTLVLRPYVRPTCLFRHMEKLTGREGFASVRHSTEMSVRRQLGREIKLQEIYDAMPEFLDLIDMEIDMEISVSAINKEIRDLIADLRALGKKIVLISDMYLSKDVVVSILSHCEFLDYDGLYVSSEYGVSKHTGELYDLVMKDLDTTPEKIFHVGDNKHSDYDVPRRKNICAHLYIKPLDQYIRLHPDEYRIYKRNSTLDNSILVGMDVLHSMSEDIWYEIGYRFGGPLATAYSLFILGGLKDGQTILFASRDGYNLKRIVDSIHGEDNTHYVYVQRLIMDVLTENKLKYGPVKLPNKNSDRFAYESVSNAMRHIISFFSDDLEGVENIRPEDVPEYYNCHIDTIDRLRKTGLSQYRDYLTGICRDDDICLVDCTTMKYSSQKLVEDVIGRKIDGCYLVTIEDNDGYSFRSMHMKKGLMIGWSNINFPEFFLSSPEFPLIGWNGSPKQNDVHECEIFRTSIYGEVSDGELSYANDFIKVFGKYSFSLDYKSVVKWSKLCSIRGTDSCEALKKIKWASDPDHSLYQSLIMDGSTLLYYMKNMVTTLVSKMNRR